MKKIYFILLTLFVLSSCKDKDTIGHDWIDLRGIDGTWKFNGDRDFTVEFIPEYGKDLTKGKLITRKEGDIEDVVDIVGFIHPEGYPPLIFLSEDSPVGNSLEINIINKEDIRIHCIYDGSVPLVPRPIHDGHYIKTNSRHTGQ